MPEQLSGLLIYATSTPPWLVRLAKVSTGSEIYPNYFWLPTFSNCSDVQFFDSPSFSKHIQLGYLWLPTSPFATPLLPTGHHVMPTTTKCFPPNPYLEKQIISLGVLIILSTCFWSHTEPDFNQLLIIRDWYLRMSKPKDVLLMVKSVTKLTWSNCSLRKSISKLLFQKQTNLSLKN